MKSIHQRGDGPCPRRVLGVSESLYRQSFSCCCVLEIGVSFRVFIFSQQGNHFLYGRVLRDGHAMNVLYWTATPFIVRTLKEGEKDVGRRAIHV